MPYIPEPITTPLDLKNRVQSVLSDLIGSYLHPNGYIEPAVSVGSRHAEGIKVTGIEAIVPKVFTIKSSQWIAGGVHQERYADIILIEWSGDNLSACGDRLLRHFPNSKGLEIPDYDPIKTLRRYRVTVWLPDTFLGYKV